MGTITRTLANNLHHFGSNTVETGTWTPTTNIGFASVAEAKYIKIGKFVQADVSATYNAGPGDASQASSFGGLPFSGDNDCESISFNVLVEGHNEPVYSEVSGTGGSMKSRTDNVPLVRSQIGNRTLKATFTYTTDID
jgi:hypothetical protein